MTTRRLGPADAASAYACRLRALADSPTAFGTALEDEVARGPGFLAAILARADDDNVIFGALDDDGKVVGMAGVYREDRIKIRHKAMVWGVYVDPSERGKGLARLLMELALAHARDRMRVVSAYLAVVSTNASARRLYAALGFTRWGTEPRAFLIDGRYYDDEHLVLHFDA